MGGHPGASRPPSSAWGETSDGCSVPATRGRSRRPRSARRQPSLRRPARRPVRRQSPAARNLASASEEAASTSCSSVASRGSSSRGVRSHPRSCRSRPRWETTAFGGRPSPRGRGGIAGRPEPGDPLADAEPAIVEGHHERLGVELRDREAHDVRHALRWVTVKPRLWDLVLDPSPESIGQRPEPGRLVGLLSRAASRAAAMPATRDVLHPGAALALPVIAARVGRDGAPTDVEHSAPNGPPNLCADSEEEIHPERAGIDGQSSRRLARVEWNKTPASRASRAASPSGWIVPPRGWRAGPTRARCRIPGPRRRTRPGRRDRTRRRGTRTTSKPSLSSV